ncbi:hypothetical protein CERSUDRAFT_112417 [Gelatoporia subvermispora B]|uniref:Uncharacterized protein n=1 Tax=Ceriporiopsis subvermispora (strain B) TaxID=914234 RepID=M2PU06_CERS8|nr:hypothetical protein CERSUDRAFT_112417 [Gelatoporia subvermispora B]
MSTVRRGRIRHFILCDNLMSASHDVGFHLHRPISSFSVNVETGRHDDEFFVSVRDTEGWLHSVEIESSNFNQRRELGLLSEVSAVCHWKTRLVAASFGTPCKLVVGHIRRDEYEGAWQLLHLPEYIYDVRTAHLFRNRLVLGAAKRGVLIPDLDASVHTVNLSTESSDVLAVHQDEHLVYIGARNGSIGRCDIRIMSCKGWRSLLPEQSGHGSVLHLDVVREWQLLVSTVKGDLKTYDLRFVRNATPLLQFLGHVNSFTLKLGIAVDPAHEVLFAAGQDQHIRAWSLHDGAPLDPGRISNSHSRRQLLDQATPSFRALSRSGGVI